MVSCAVRSCTSRNNVDNKKSTGITFHRFPKDRRLDTWIRFVNRGTWKPSKYSVLCSKHFSEEFFDRSSLRYVRLKDNAIPTLNQAQVQLQVPLPAGETSTSTPTITHNIDLVSLPSTSSTKDSMDISVYETSASYSESSCTSTSLIDPTVTPRKRKLMVTLNKTILVSRDRKKRLASVRKRLHRREKRIASMKAIVAELRKKNYMQEEYVDIIAKLGGPQELYLRQYKKTKKQPLPKQYSEELKVFALTLHYYSPAAYNYVHRVLSKAQLG